MKSQVITFLQQVSHNDHIKQLFLSEWRKQDHLSTTITSTGKAGGRAVSMKHSTQKSIDYNEVTME